MAHRYRRSIADPNDPRYHPPHRHSNYGSPSSEEASEQHNIEYFQSQLFTCILEDLLIKMGILTQTKTDYQVIKLMSQIDKMLAKKFNVRDPRLMSTADLLDELDPNDLNNMLHKLNKLEDDRKYLIDVIVDLYIELYVNRTFMTLINNVEEVIQKEHHFIELKHEENKNKNLRREAYKQLRQQRNHIKTVLYDSNMNIEELKSQLEDVEMEDAVRGRYIDNWQNARSEQHTQVIDDKEYEHSSVSEYFKRRSEHEVRVHSDVDMLINIQINETLTRVEEWMAKYDKDLESIELKIQLKKIDYQNAKGKRILYEETLEKHDKEMKDWVHFKEEREKARLYREKMLKSAITVQAWWRGLLVRRQLGPYKGKKGKKGKKKKEAD